MTQSSVEKKKDGGCTFYHNTLPTSLTRPIKDKESHIFAIFVPVLTALRMLGLNILKLFCMFL